MTSKLAPHFQMPAELKTEATETVRAGAFPWVKGIDPDHWHCAPATMFPGKRILARLVVPQKDDAWEHTFMGRGEAGAREYAALLGPRYDKLVLGGCLDVEGPNEPHPTPADWRAYEDFECAWIGEVNRRGLRPWAWSFGVGWPGLKAAIPPDPVTASMFRESIVAATRVGGGLALHEYAAPTMRDGDGWWTLRYRRLLSELYAAGVQPGQVRIALAEVGISGGLVGKGDVGWKTFMGADEYRDGLAWYDSQICQSAEVVAAFVFTTCPTVRWGSFDVNGAMLKWMAARHDAPPTPPEPPTPEPPTPPAPAIDLAALRKRLAFVREGVLRAEAALDVADEELLQIAGLLG